MARSKARRIGIGLVTLGLALATTTGGAAAAAGKDRAAPTAPKNLHVTATTSYSVSLAWAASSDKSGIASYTICCTPTSRLTVGGSTTGATITAGVEAGRSYSFFVFATDIAGNSSSNSNAVSVTTPPDTIPPSTPVVTVTSVGPIHASLAWSSIDDGPNVWFSVFMDGGMVMQGTRDTAGTFAPLAPSSTHVFQVQAEDFAHHRSPLSSAVTVTTPGAGSGDTTPPTSPGNLRTNGMQFSDGETWLFWNAASDDVTPPSLIEYRVFINGLYDHSVVGGTSTILYGNPRTQNTYSVVARDNAGNDSAPATIIVDNN